MDAIVQALLRLSQLVTDFPEIKELDINPFMAGQPGQTSVAVDARISVER
jgi:acetyltransferase